MKKSMAVVCVVLLAAAIGSLAVAGKGESQRGGLPALEDRVEKLEARVSALISQVGSLEKGVNALQSAVSSLQNLVAKLGTAVADLKGQNNWAVVTSSGDVVRHSGGADVIGTKLGTGTYDVLFTKTKVVGCAYVATIGDFGRASANPGLITVSGGQVGGSDKDVHVQTFDFKGDAADRPFHLYVSCP